MNFSTSEENYIKAIYLLQQAGDVVSTNEVADKLQTKAASVTDMLKKLKVKNLLNYEPYKGFTLSKNGRKLALNVIRKHRLWEYFLVQHLKFEWNEVHEIAEELEHISSPLLIERLDNFLNFPKFDPHGDPIPDSKGKMEITNHLPLTDLNLNCRAEVKAVANQSTELLHLLRHKNIGIGTMLKVVKKFSFDNSIEIKVDKHASFNISRQLAETLLVNPTE